MNGIDKLEFFINSPFTEADELFNFFDTLDPFPPEIMQGYWRGNEIASDNPLEGLLTSLGWYGKIFSNPDKVDPLVFSKKGKMYRVDPGKLPAGVLNRRKASKLKLLPVFFNIFNRCFRTNKPKARIRKMEYRGKYSTAMIYDDLPIIDYFRKIDCDNVMGVMDWKGHPPFFFSLSRDQNRQHEFSMYNSVINIL